MRYTGGRELARRFLAGASILDLTMREYRCTMAHVASFHELYDDMEKRLRRALKRYAPLRKDAS